MDQRKEVKGKNDTEYRLQNTEIRKKMNDAKEKWVESKGREIDDLQ